MKIFGIGLSRTGTTSLIRAFEILGYHSCHSPGTIDQFFSNNALADTPVVVGYQFLDIMFPGSKFILTDRDEADWLRSCESIWRKYLQEQSEFLQHLHLALYNTVQFSEGKFRAARRRHLTAVKEYFAGRPNDLLEMRICEGEGWERLCPFLGKPIPDVPFPRENEFWYAGERDVAERRANALKIS
jgi:hypothetical protein